MIVVIDSKNYTYRDPS